MTSRSTRVAIVGPHGYGWTHRRAVHRLQLEGLAHLVAICARTQVRAAEDAPVDGVPVYQDHARMLAETHPDIVIIATPPHAHLPVALTAMAAGADLLIEKPAVASLADFAALAGAARATGARCQVGFQALGSPALAKVVTAISAGQLGKLRTVSAACAWWRPDAYFRRTPWAGRRSLDGQPVVDGALANQFSHAIMQCLAIAESVEPTAVPLLVEIERYRTSDIEVDDTACLRIILDNDVVVGAAVTTRSREQVTGEIDVVGQRRAALEYITDRVRMPGDDDWHTIGGRPSLLENLLANRNGDAELIAPLDRTKHFTAILEAVLACPTPPIIGARQLVPHPDGDGHAVGGIADTIRMAAARTALFSELGVPWARPAHRIRLDQTQR